MKNLIFAIITLMLFSCKKESTTQPVNPVNPIPSITGNFSFKFNGTTITGDTYTCTFLSPENYLTMGGSSPERPQPNTVFTVYLKMPTSSITTGAYFTNTISSGSYITYQSRYASNSYHIYTASNTTTEKITLNIVSYNTSTKAITCTFNGALDYNGTSNSVTNGTITGILQ